MQSKTAPSRSLIYPKRVKISPTDHFYFLLHEEFSYGHRRLYCSWDNNFSAYMCGEIYDLAA